MWYIIFMTLLKMIGPYVIEKLIDWIFAEMTGAVSGEPPQVVKSQPRAAKVIKRILKDEATRELRLATMRAAIARAKKNSYPIV